MEYIEIYYHNLLKLGNYFSENKNKNFKVFNKFD
jgi:hypothetical protein